RSTPCGLVGNSAGCRIHDLLGLVFRQRKQVYRASVLARSECGSRGSNPTARRSRVPDVRWLASGRDRRPPRYRRYAHAHAGESGGVLVHRVANGLSAGIQAAMGRVGRMDWIVCGADDNRKRTAAGMAQAIGTEIRVPVSFEM